MWAILLLSSVCLVGQSYGSSFVTGSTTDSPDEQCDEGYNKVPYNHICFKVVNKRRTWDQAQTFCNKDTPHGGLVEIIDEEENLYINDFLSRRRYWIGIKSHEDGHFSFYDKFQTSYRNWAPNQPTHSRDGMCVEMLSERDGAWNDRSCKKKRPFICQMDPYGLASRK